MCDICKNFFFYSEKYIQKPVYTPDYNDQGVYSHIHVN